MKIILAILIILFLVVDCIAPNPTPTVSPISPVATPQAQANPTRIPIVVVPGNLLIDPSMEGPYRNEGMPEVNTSYAWHAWYSCQGDQSVCEPPCKPGAPDCYLPCPENCKKSDGKCQSDYGCYWCRPEFVPIYFDQAFYRIHSGDVAQKYFTYGRMGRGGLLQTVAITPGTWLRFTVWMQAWMCYDYAQCDGGRLSDQPSDMHLKVGIDPTGGTDVNSPAVVWGAEQEAFDRWVEFSVVAKSLSDTVTVFTSGGAVWEWARANNDVYEDDATLVITMPLTHTVVLPGIWR
jgi:hypothetical protein